MGWIDGDDLTKHLHQPDRPCQDARSWVPRLYKEELYDALLFEGDVGSPWEPMIPDVVDDGGFLVMSGKHWKFPRKNVLNVQTAEKPLVRVHETLYKTDICSVWLISGKFTWPCTTPSWGTGNDTVLGQPWFGLFVAFLFYHKWTSPEKPAQYMNSSAGFPRLAVSLQPFRSWHIMTMLYQLPKDLGILPYTSICFHILPY